MTAFNYAPQGWMICDGSTLQIAQYPTLFTVIGATFGGDGHTTFALPDLRGRTPVCDSQSSTFVIGQSGGSETVTLTTTEMPGHQHGLMGSSANATEQSPGGNVWATEATGQFACYTAVTSWTQPNYSPGTMSANALQSAGGGGGHPNLQPYLAISFCICVGGNVPPRQ